MKAHGYKSSKLIFLTGDGEGSRGRIRSIGEHDAIFGPVRQSKAGDGTPKACCIADRVSRATSRRPFNRDQDLGKCGLKAIPANKIFGTVGFVREVFRHNRTTAI